MVQDPDCRRGRVNRQEDDPQSYFLVDVLRLWFGFCSNVSRGQYAATGFGLMVAKYAVEASSLWMINSVFLKPVDFLNPVFSIRQELVQGAPEWLGWVWFFWTLPFLWIAVTMSVRRAVCSGRSPWIGLLVLVPVVNLATMLMLTALSDRQPRKAVLRPDQQSDIRVEVPAQRFRRAALGVFVGLCIGFGLACVSIYAFDTYGASLFLGTPVLMGAVASLIFNSATRRKYSASIRLGMLTVVLAGGALLVVALEGVICIAMAAPIAIPLGGLGGVIGKIIAETTVRPIQGTMAMIMFLPAWAGVEGVATPQREFVVTSAVEIDAAIDHVWDGVIHFPELQEPDEWYFRWGIACPMRAEIDGVGVGAVRRCIFTTGTFVEPITTWDEPHRLAFDVESQPAPMFELTPYSHVHPPHLDGALRSTRGEFVLKEVSNSKTLLVGRTWYEFDMFPHFYWTLWSDLMIHRIHKRVLEHVKLHAETNS